MYAKLIDGNLKYITYIPNVSNATEDALKTYAIKNGYKVVKETEQPHQYCTVSYTEYGSYIKQVWTEDSLESVKQQYMEQVQTQLNSALETRVSVPCSLGFDVVFDTQAQMNIMGLIAFGKGGTLIDANDQTHELSNDDLQTVALTLSDYKANLYNQAQEKREKINNCTTIQELLELQ